MPWSERAELVTRPGWHPSLDPPHAAGPPFAMGPAIHDVRCRGCAAFPIAGTRRRCLLCLDADFCASCARLHDHAAFIELHHPVHEEWGQTFALLTALPALVGADASPRDDDEDEHHDDSPFFLPGPDPASPAPPAGLAAPPPRGLHERLRAFLVSGAEGLARHVGLPPDYYHHPLLPLRERRRRSLPAPRAEPPPAPPAAVARAAAAFERLARRRRRRRLRRHAALRRATLADAARARNELDPAHFELVLHADRDGRGPGRSRFAPFDDTAEDGLAAYLSRAGPAACLVSRRTDQPLLAVQVTAELTPRGWVKRLDRRRDREEAKAGGDDGEEGRSDEEGSSDSDAEGRSSGRSSGRSRRSGRSGRSASASLARRVDAADPWTVVFDSGDVEARVIVTNVSPVGTLRVVVRAADGGARNDAGAGAARVLFDGTVAPLRSAEVSARAVDGRAIRVLAGDVFDDVERAPPAFDGPSRRASLAAPVSSPGEGFGFITVDAFPETAFDRPEHEGGANVPAGDPPGGDPDGFWAGLEWRRLETFVAPRRAREGASGSSDPSLALALDREDEGREDASVASEDGAAGGAPGPREAFSIPALRGPALAARVVPGRRVAAPKEAAARGAGFGGGSGGGVLAEGSSSARIAPRLTLRLAARPGAADDDDTSDSDSNASNASSSSSRGRARRESAARFLRGAIASAERRRLAGAFDGATAAETCVICLESSPAPDCVLLPCKHQCCHASEAGKLARCPLCRARVESRVARGRGGALQVVRGESESESREESAGELFPPPPPFGTWSLFGERRTEARRLFGPVEGGGFTFEGGS